jgi:formamidopyrimidine-DNA glycosylase
VLQESKGIKLTANDVQHISENYFCTNVLRKGKQLCLCLRPGSKEGEKKKKFLYLHMGMTGRIRVPGRFENWGGKSNGPPGKKGMNEEEAFPPKYAHLTFQTGAYQAAFADPRKFGSCHLSDDLTALEQLAPDALTTNDPKLIQEQIVPALTDQTVNIKTLLLDQKRVVSGVGNWVADEVLYQTGIHPQQSHLSTEEAANIFTKLQSILSTATDCLKNDMAYPEDWLFGYRWTKKRAAKDSAGRTIHFITCGGRTSAVIPSLQKLRKGRPHTQGGGKRKAVSLAANKTPTKDPSNKKKRVCRTVTPEETDEPVSNGRRRSPRFEN